MDASEVVIKGYSDCDSGPEKGNSGAGKVDAETALYTELWRACAGPLVTVPREQELVFYFPQGHIEQVEASTNQSADQQLPVYNLPPKILCRVVNVHLKAEPDTDEVFAQVTLMPEPNQDENAVKKEPLPLHLRVFMFILSVKLLLHRTQALMAFSIMTGHVKATPHTGIGGKRFAWDEWRFRHIFRGQPRRHLLQSGWSVFVSSKRLVAGDAFIFLRGENGELRVGVRRAMRQQSNAPSSVISSHSMHLGVLATAWHAIQTKTMFTVYYKPACYSKACKFSIVRDMNEMTSPAEFIVPYDQYMESVKNNYSIGMRFKMRFEGEEAPEQRFTGTIVGIEDADPKNWPESKWRCLKVRWDETSTVPRPERVSPWKIEHALSPPALNPLPVHRPKRPRPSALPTSPDSSVLTREGLSKMTVDPSPGSGFPRVLQGQEVSTLRGSFAESNDSDSSEKPLLWNPSLDDGKIDSASRRNESDIWLPSGRSSFTDLLSTFGSKINSPRDFSRPPADQASYKRQTQEREAKLSSIANTWSIMPSGLSLNLMDSGLKNHVRGTDTSYQTHGDARYDVFGEFSMIPDSRGEKQQTNWLMPPPVSSYHQLPPVHSREQIPRSVIAQHHAAMKPNEGKCKLFGIPLISNPAPIEPVLSHRNVVIEPSGHIPHLVHSHLSPAIESDQRSDLSKSSKVCDYPVATSEQEKQFHSLPPVARDRESKGHSGSTRSCTKVHKQGSALGRSVDLAKFDNYDELISELDNLFEFNGELKARNKNWLVVYTDDEDDMMLVGDDPWEEFCGMVRKILILTKEEVQRMSPGTFNSKREETSSATEGVDAKEVKDLPTSLSPDD
ncbi:Auxin response factor 2A [Sesamum angolense]|uniref:Auxin response factor n=1 Tax=Sesamum angolense TaxID=2727404 RepID=A0AAE1XF22_9LAMI|nr:Auxin response factor 2A [Sesamum angolense]